MEEQKNITEERYKSETQNLEFKVRKIEFYPEDVEKMKNMTLEEQNAYVIKLKRARRFVVVEE